MEMNRLGLGDDSLVGLTDVVMASIAFETVMAFMC